jgi:hypothetical protein
MRPQGPGHCETRWRRVPDPQLRRRLAPRVAVCRCRPALLLRLARLVIPLRPPMDAQATTLLRAVPGTRVLRLRARTIQLRLLPRDHRAAD